MYPSGGENIAEVVRCEVVPKISGFPFGTVVSGLLVLRAPLALCSSKEWGTYNLQQEHGRLELLLEGHERIRSDIDSPAVVFLHQIIDVQEDEIAEHWFVPLVGDLNTSTDGILVALSHSDELGGGTRRKYYRRVGYAHTFALSGRRSESIIHDLPSVNICVV